jgi:heme oxygenase
MTRDEQLERDLIVLGDARIRSEKEVKACVKRIIDYIRDVACTEAEKEVNQHANGYLHSKGS